jgi:UDP-2-acetamido-3-amino-2,3-dideoxy-glucuronate N-acetyltransferase
MSASDYNAHQTAIIDPGARIESGTRIWHWTHISAGARIGRNCTLGQNVYVGNATIGDGVRIQNNVSVYDGVTLEDDVFCGPSMVFTNVINPRSHISRKDEFRKTLVKKGATIGANATILCGHTVGIYAMIGAGAVVTKDVADFALLMGAPARQKGWICKCGVSLPGAQVQPTCDVCKQSYRIADGVCRLA